jgi:lipoate-protein ligase A
MWRLIDLGPIDGYTMTNLYEAVGLSVSSGESPNTVILNHPERPFVNIGYHQLMEKEIDVEYARSQGFDLVRRTIGGGAILDGPWEQDYFVIVNRESSDCPVSIQEFYQKYLRPPVKALKKLGLDAVVRQPNDILVNGKKISGNGAITIEKTNVLAGDLLLETPTDLMSRIIKAPDEKFQDKVAESMEEWLTSIRSLAPNTEREAVKQLYIESFEEEFDANLVHAALTNSEKKTLTALIDERKKEDWIFSKDNDFRSLVSDQKVTKIRGGVLVSESIYKAGKMIRVILISEEDKILGISLSGDFFTIPYEGALETLEESLIGNMLDSESLMMSISDVYEKIGLKTLGVDQGDFVKAIMNAKPKKL